MCEAIQTDTLSVEQPPLHARPRFVQTEEQVQRWDLCEQLSMEFFEARRANADVMDFSRWLYFSEIPTTPES